VPELRPFRAEDVHEVGRLHRKVWLPSRGVTSEMEDEYSAWLRDVYLEHPWQHPQLRSLVAERDGRIVGFIGVVPRPIKLAGNSLMAAVSSQLIVGPEGHKALAGIHLIREFLRGPQDLSIADEANDASRKIWEMVGGATCSIASVGWIHVLRPTGYLAYRLAGRKRLRTIRAFRGLSGPLDTGLGALRRSPQAPATVTTELMSTVELHAWLEDDAWSGRVRPRYELEALEWLLSRAGGRQGQLRQRAVRGANGRTLGCYLYRMGDDRIAELVLLQAHRGRHDAVFTSLLCDAHDTGALALSGRLSPGLIGPVASARSQFLSTPQWSLFHSTSDAISRQLHDGTALLSRLDGEYPLRLR